MNIIVVHLARSGVDAICRRWWLEILWQSLIIALHQTSRCIAVERTWQARAGRPLEHRRGVGAVRSR